MEVGKNLKVYYAILKGKEKVAWGRGRIPSWNEVAVPIVCKCYLVEKRRKYITNKDSEVYYEVVFTHKQEEPGSTYFVPEFPTYDWNGKCTNATLVHQIFDSFEKAKITANKANKKIADEEIGTLPLDNNMKEEIKYIKAKHQVILDKYEKVENTINKETSDIKISRLEDLLLEEIMTVNDEMYRKLAQALSKEEREYIKMLLQNSSIDVDDKQKKRKYNA